MRNELASVKEYYTRNAAIKGYLDYCFTIKGMYTPILCTIQARKLKLKMLRTQIYMQLISYYEMTQVAYLSIKKGDRQFESEKVSLF